jgi:hypothetical protein
MNSIMIAASCILLTAGIAVYVFLGPLMGRRAYMGAQKTRLAFLQERKEVVYENLRDLNFEFKAGKLPPQDFASLRDSMEQEAAAILSEIEQLEAGAAA